MTRRVDALSQDLDQQVLKDLAQYFSLQFDDSPDIMDTPQLLVLVRMAFQDSTTNEEYPHPSALERKEQR